MRYKNLILIGTSHIARQSVDQIEKAIGRDKPDIVAIELDRKRLASLLGNSGQKVYFSNIKRIGIKGFLFSIIGAWAEKKMGRIVGVRPGADMLKAVQLAKNNNSLIALIDQDIEVTLRNISRTFSWLERWHLFVDVFKAVFFGDREMKKLGVKSVDLSKVPPKSLIVKLIRQMRVRYPNLYKSLIDDRNKVMASNLLNLMHQNPYKRIVAVVGAGHEDEVFKLIKAG